MGLNYQDTNPIKSKPLSELVQVKLQPEKKKEDKKDDKKENPQG